MAIPEFIQAELIGPYGESLLHKLGNIERWYHIYAHGAEFETEGTDDYTPSKLQSKQIKKLIDKEAQFAFGRTPELKVMCPDEKPDADKTKPNESAMQRFLDVVLKKKLVFSQADSGRKGLLYRRSRCD